MSHATSAAAPGHWPFAPAYTPPDVVPPPADPAARLAALRATALLDTPAERAFDRLTRLATRTLGVPVALVTLVDEDRQFFKSCVGLPEPWASLRETPLSHSFCQHAVARARPLVIEDAREHPLVCDNAAIQDIGVIAYAGIPLVTADGDALGSFCAIDVVPRRWTAGDLETLADLAAAAMTEIELRTALRRAEEARAEAAAATRAKDDLLAFVSHELRTPLTGVALNAQLLGMGAPLDERQARALERIDRSQRHLLALTNQLLDFRAAASGRAEYALERVDARDAVADALGLVAAQLDAAGLRTVWKPPPAGRVAARADAPKLRQILVNLLGNAARHTPAGGTVTVDAAAGGGLVRLVVRDTGVGIAADQLDRIFEPFARVHDRRAAPAEGTGLGLTISRALARGMHGDVTVASAPGAGSAFTVTLPAA